jgi:hypothetical protein
MDRKAPTDLRNEPWWVIAPVTAFMLGLAWLIFESANLGKRSWEVPRSESLRTFVGTFEPTPDYHRAPYVVRGRDGEALILVCTPDSRVVMCLDEARITRASLAGKLVTVRYFTVHKRSFRHPNILSSLSVDGKEVLRFDERAQVLRRDARLEDQRREEGDLFALLCMFVSIGPPIYLIYRKLRFSPL